MQRVATILIWLTLVPVAANAGAWPRGEGKIFATLSHHTTIVSLTGPVSNYTALYLEYGVNDRLTLGLDVGHGVSGKSKAVVFLRGPIVDLDRYGRLAWEVGTGFIDGAKVVRPGLSYGLGFSLMQRSGWFAIDTLAEIDMSSGRVDTKADITLGLNLSPRLKTFVQLQTGKSHGDPNFVRVVPSAVLRIAKGTHVEFGLSQGLRGDHAYGLKLGMWKEF